MKHTFNQVEDGQTYGDIRVAFSQLVTDDPTAAGWAYIPGEPEESGDIWLDRFSGAAIKRGHLVTPPSFMNSAMPWVWLIPLKAKKTIIVF